MVASGILPWFRGIAVHDFWHPYERFDDCNAHLIRELRAIHENTGQEWASDLKKLLVWAQHKKKAFIAAGKDRFSSYCYRYRIDNPFDELLASGLVQNSLPTGKLERGRPKKARPGISWRDLGTIRRRSCSMPGTLRSPSTITKLSHTQLQSEA